MLASHARKLQKTDRHPTGSRLVGIHPQPITHRYLRGRKIRLRHLQLNHRGDVCIYDSPTDDSVYQSNLWQTSKNGSPPARFWLLIYGSISTLALTALILGGFGYVLYLAIPGVPVFAWHLWLVSQRTERKQAGIEIIATGVLSLAAPAAYWIALGGYNPLGWWLWAWAWLQSSASIVYAYLRLEQRELKIQPESRELWRMGKRALIYTSFNLFASLMLGWANLIPQLIFIPFLLQWIETLWGITHPAIGWKPNRIGVRQLIVSTLWTILFIFCWRS
jgi:hypothetical protein